MARLASSYLNIRQVNNNLLLYWDQPTGKCCSLFVTPKIASFMFVCVENARGLSCGARIYDVDHVTESLEPHSTAPSFQARRAQSAPPRVHIQVSFFEYGAPCGGNCSSTRSFFHTRTRDSPLPILHNSSLRHLPPNREI